jgi:hypothetical protein
MDCRQYSDILNVFLDGEIQGLPGAAKQHVETCAPCQSLTRELESLSSAIENFETFQLTREGKSLLTTKVMRTINSSVRKKSFRVNNLMAEFFVGLRWRNVFATAAVAIVVFWAVLQYRGEELSTKTALMPEEEIEFLLEEHTLQMESSIFQSGALPMHIVATVASGRR